MIAHILFALYLVGVSTVFALLEIQIEGEAGWGSNLPTWRLDSAFARHLLGARTITGYHLYVHLFVLLIAHAGFAVGAVPFTWPAELRLIAFLVLFWVLEDFLWFVLNPAYGIRAFKRERILWHAQSWWGFMPRDYWIFAPVGVALYAASFAI